MKKLILLVLVFCLIPFLANGWVLKDEFNTARTGAIHGTVTQANMRLSLVAGTAFVDFSQLGVLTNRAAGSPRNYLKICDSAAKCIYGYIGAAGTAETLDSDLFDAGAGVFTSGTYGWAVYGTTTIENDTNTLKVTYGNHLYGAYDILRADLSGDLSSNLTLGAMYKITYTAKVNAGSSVDLVVSLNVSNQTNTITATDMTAGYRYFTHDTTNASLRFNNMGTGEIIWLDNLVLKQVLTPSYTGVLIHDAASSGNQNWVSEDSGFNRNDSSGYTYTISASPTDANVINATSAEPIGGARTVVDTYAGTELVTTNAGFETCTGCTADDATNDNFDTWTEMIGGTDVADWSTAQKRSGSYSVKFIRGNSGSSSIRSPAITVIPSKSYTYSFSYYGDGTNVGRYMIYDITNSKYLQSDDTWAVGSAYLNSTLSAASWGTFTKTFTTSSNTTSIYVYISCPSAGGASGYFDDISLLPTSGLVSIADGKLTFAGGKATPASGEPYINYSTTARVNGKGILATYQGTTGKLFAGVGFDATQYGTISEGIGRINNVNYFETLGTGTTTYSDLWTSSKYYFGYFMKSAGGGYSFGKIDGSVWKLWYSSYLPSTANPYPSISNYSDTFTTDFLRIPTQTWLPTPLAYDTFTRSGAIGSTEATHPDGSPGVAPPARAWTGATWTTNGTKAINTPVTLGTDLWDAPAAAFTSGTYAWVKYGNNTIENDTNSLKITYVDNASGAYVYLRNNTDLSSDLTVGTSYLFSTKYKVNAGSSIQINVNDGAVNNPSNNLTSTDFATYTQTFMSKSTDSATVMFYNSMGAGEIVWLDDLSLKPLTTSELISSVSTSTKDVVASVDIVRSSGPAGIITNLNSTSSPTDFILAIADGTVGSIQQCSLWAVSSGSYTALVSATTCAYSAGAKLVVIKDGDTAKLYYNNALIGGTAGNIAAAGYATIRAGTLHGLFSTYSGNTFDNYTLFPRGNGNEYQALDTLMSGQNSKLLPPHYNAGKKY